MKEELWFITEELKMWEEINNKYKDIPDNLKVVYTEFESLTCEKYKNNDWM